MSAFSVLQCVAKRTRQLERLLYMLEATAIKFEQVKSQPSCTSSVLLATRIKTQVQKRYGKLLFDFLEKERGLRIPALLADSVHLESNDEELQQLLVLVEDEELLYQRVGGIWDFLVVTSIDQEIVVLVRICECLWNDLLPQTSMATSLINSMRGEPELPSCLRNTEELYNAVHPLPPTIQSD